LAGAGAGARGPLCHAIPEMPVPVVLRPLLGIGKHLVSLPDLLEPLLGSLVAGVEIGMVLPSETTVRLADLLLGRVAGYAENLVVGTLHGRHGCSRLPTLFSRIINPDNDLVEKVLQELC